MYVSFKPKLSNHHTPFRVLKFDKYHKQHQAAKRRRAMHKMASLKAYADRSERYWRSRQNAIKRLKSNPKAYMANKLFWYKVKWQHRYKRKAQGDKFWRFAKDY